MSYTNSINNFNYYQSSLNVKKQENNQSMSVSLPISDAGEPKHPSVSFRGYFSSLLGINNNVKTPDEKAKYDEVYKDLSPVGKRNLDKLLTAGILYDDNSNDKSSVLDNLYKIKTTPRREGFNENEIIEEVVENLADPFKIEQHFEEIPNELKRVLFQQEMAKPTKLPNAPKTLKDLDVESSTCVAASTEVNMAFQQKAEYVRYAEGLTSPKGEVKVRMKYSDISSNYLSVLDILRTFKADYKPINKEELEMTLRPDDNAFIRAQISNAAPQKGKRNSIDALMQSTFMQLGSQNTYNSLTDKRYGELSDDSTGLNSLEKTFVETVVENDGPKTEVVYQNIEIDDQDNKRLTGYIADFKTIQNQLINTLNSGKNLTVGVLEFDNNGYIIGGGGHEIDIVGTKVKNGELYFVCTETDDYKGTSIEVKVSELVPKIHHTTIPDEIFKQSPLAIPPQPQNEFLQFYRELKAQPQPQSQSQSQYVKVA